MAMHPLLSTLLASVGDAEGERTVTSIVALLVALGLGLLMMAVWLYRTTRPDPEVLAPLEAMSERTWQRSDPVAQRRRLDELRPTGAVPLQPSVAPPDIDEAFDLGPAATGFDDLHDRTAEGADDDAHAEDEGHGGGDEQGGGDVDTATEPDVDGEVGNGDGEPDDDRGSERRVPSFEVPTPTQITRPVIIPEFDDEFDPDLLASALADLDAELGRSGAADADAADDQA